jgi:hypothetical protein
MNAAMRIIDLTRISLPPSERQQRASLRGAKRRSNPEAARQDWIGLLRFARNDDAAAALP